METRAHYITVGIFVLLLLLGLVGAVVWLAKWQSDRQFARYDIVFTGSVQGIRNGSSVNFLGIGVGQVIDIRIEEVSRVRVTIELTASTPIREGTRASVEPSGLTGGAVVRLNPGPATAPPLAAKHGERYPVIPSEPGRLERLIEGAPLLVDRIDLLLQRLNRLASDENIAHVSEMLRTLAATSTALAGNTQQITRAVDDAAAIMANGRAASVDIARLAKQLEGDARRLGTQAGRTLKNADAALAEARGAAKSAGGAADAARKILDDNRGAIGDFANTGLYELSNLAGDLRALIIALQHVATEFDRDPARFFFGKREEGYDAK